MPAGRFLVAGTALTPGAELMLPVEVAHQTRDVLRLGVGATISLLDGAGGEYIAEIIAVSRTAVVVRLGERREGQTEPAAHITLCVGMLKAAKFEWVLQKGTELGVAVFIPLLTERAVAATEEMGASKRRRYERILAEAVEQCGGTRLPELAAPRPLMHAMASLPPGGVALIPWEEARGVMLRQALHTALTDRAARGETSPPADIRLFIGPEGGFSAGEVALAQRQGAIPVTLGPRILRAETAALVAVTLTLDTLDLTIDAPPMEQGEDDS